MATKKTAAPIHPFLEKLSLTRRTKEEIIDGNPEQLGDWLGTPFTMRRINPDDYTAYNEALERGEVNEARAILVHAATADPVLSLEQALELMTKADFVAGLQVYNKEVAFNGLLGFEGLRAAERAERESEQAKAKAAAAKAAGEFPGAD